MSSFTIDSFRHLHQFGVSGLVGGHEFHNSSVPYVQEEDEQGEPERFSPRVSQGDLRTCSANKYKQKKQKTSSREAMHLQIILAVFEVWSEVPKRGRSKRGRRQKRAKERKKMQKGANASPHESPKERKRARKSTQKIAST